MWTYGTGIQQAVVSNNSTPFCCVQIFDDRFAYANGTAWGTKLGKYFYNADGSKMTAETGTSYGTGFTFGSITTVGASKVLYSTLAVGTLMQGSWVSPVITTFYNSVWDELKVVDPNSYYLDSTTLLLDENFETFNEMQRHGWTIDATNVNQNWGTVLNSYTDPYIAIATGSSDFFIGNVAGQTGTGAFRYTRTDVFPSTMPKYGHIVFKWGRYGAALGTGGTLAVVNFDFANGTNLSILANRLNSTSGSMILRVRYGAQIGDLGTFTEADSYYAMSFTWGTTQAKWTYRWTVNGTQGFGSFADIYGTSNVNTFEVLKYTGTNAGAGGKFWMDNLNVFGTFSGQDNEITKAQYHTRNYYYIKTSNDNTTWGGVGRDVNIFQINDYYHPVKELNLENDWKANIAYAKRMFDRDGGSFIRWTCGKYYGI